MPGKHRFDDELAAIEQLRHLEPQAAVAPLRKALSNRSNYIVAKAADLVRELRRPELIPDLLTAFDRFFMDPIKTDPQCWAKNALSHALAAIEFQDAEVFLRGMRHFQLEPIWGGQSDTAATLRGTCALALVACRTLPEAELLNYLLELFADKEKSVRVEAARAVDQVSSRSAALLLRLRAVLGGDEPEVLGACYSGILRIEGTSAIRWIRHFLAGGNDVAAEAAWAIAADRSPAAFAALRERFLQGGHDPWFEGVLLSAIALTRQEPALDFLLGLVKSGSREAEAAVEAILKSMPSEEIIKRLESVVSGSPRLARAFAHHRRRSS
jgi:HEAT repeat protein